MDLISTADQLIIFSRYIGQQVMINSLLNNEISFGTLMGVKQNGILVSIKGVNRWLPLYDDFKVCEIKLLLKPLNKLTPDIITVANSLPVQAFITPYYQQSGFDMPVFIAPGHPCNCRYVQELDLADYRSVTEIFQHNTLLHAFESA
ncbi:hypothetical protein SNE25_10930 [Mucilaginibacter sabulilitoris]|uniref:Uncharacterized protein n=1 Tax=Mucilaginibacter sabulilitoris TaxID=1173583 RepID=A0ABZ0TVE0_9SPHI|nr:hypothetical protein [Mucilaginibacter sabulilitoris]WPU96033.1 hypothetical protein SNE25_10930 [Mucilaginibacter sabulilitoris]